MFITPIVRAEIAAHPHFEDESELEAFFSDLRIATEHPSSRVYFTAGKSFETYLNRRGDELQCPECGYETIVECPRCSASVTARQHLPADFIIGAHAEQNCDRLLSFDAGFFRDYFDVDLLTSP